MAESKRTGRPGHPPRIVAAVRDIARRHPVLSYCGIVRRLAALGIACSDKTVAKILAGRHKPGPDPVDYQRVEDEARAEAEADRQLRRDMRLALREAGLNPPRPRLSIEDVGPQLGLKAVHRRGLEQLIRERRIPAG